MWLLHLDSVTADGDGGDGGHGDGANVDDQPKAVATAAAMTSSRTEERFMLGKVSWPIVRCAFICHLYCIWTIKYIYTYDWLTVSDCDCDCD